MFVSLGFYANMMVRSRIYLEVSLPCSKGSIYSRYFFRFDLRSVFGSIEASIKKGNEKGVKEDSTVDKSSL